MQAVILAGGRGERMQGMFPDMPKHLIPVNGIPFADYQVKALMELGITSIVYCLDYASDKIVDYYKHAPIHFEKCDMSIETGKHLGTAGSIRAALRDGLLEEVFFVINGDTILPPPKDVMVAFWPAPSDDALMVVTTKRQGAPGNAYCVGGRIITYAKDSPMSLPHVDAGVIIMKRSLVEQVDFPVFGDLAEILGPLARKGKLAGFVAPGRFYEVGTPEGLKETEAYYEDI